MQQRAALAPAMVSDPKLLMMDEPFASVDALARGHLEDVVAYLWERSSFAARLVTHDAGEAVYLSPDPPIGLGCGVLRAGGGLGWVVGAWWGRDGLGGG